MRAAAWRRVVTPWHLNRRVVCVVGWMPYGLGGGRTMASDAGVSQLIPSGAPTPAAAAAAALCSLIDRYAGLLHARLAKPLYELASRDSSPSSSLFIEFDTRPPFQAYLFHQLVSPTDLNNQKNFNLDFICSIRGLVRRGYHEKRLKITFLRGCLLYSLRAQMKIVAFRALAFYLFPRGTLFFLSPLTLLFFHFSFLPDFAAVRIDNFE